MTAETKLPPLPEKVVITTHLPTGVRIYGYTADQMQAYASEAVKLNARGSRAPLSLLTLQYLEAEANERGLNHEDLG